MNHICGGKELNTRQYFSFMWPFLPNLPFEFGHDVLLLTTLLEIYITLFLLVIGYVSLKLEVFNSLFAVSEALSESHY